MKYSRSIILLFMLPLVGCSISNKNTYTNYNDKITTKKSIKVSAKFYIGGFGQGYHVKINDSVLSYADNTKSSIKNWEKRKITKKEIQELEKMFIYHDAPEWSSSYSVPWMQDGTQWLIKYKSPRLSVASRGSNSFPSDFNKVLKYISTTLLKGKVFQ